MMTGILTIGLIIAILSSVPMFLGRLSRRKPAKINKNGEKYFDIARFWFWFVYISASVFCTVGVGVILLTDELWAGLGFIVLGSLLGTPMLYFDRKDTSIDWTDKYVRGFKSEWSTTRHELLIEDLVSAEILAEQKGYKLTDKMGRSIYWSWPYTGWQRLIDDLKALRPDMDMKDFDI